MSRYGIREGRRHSRSLGCVPVSVQASGRNGPLCPDPHSGARGTSTHEDSSSLQYPVARYEVPYVRNTCVLSQRRLGCSSESPMRWPRDGLAKGLIMVSAHTSFFLQRKSPDHPQSDPRLRLHPHLTAYTSSRISRNLTLDTSTRAPPPSSPRALRIFIARFPRFFMSPNISADTLCTPRHAQRVAPSNVVRVDGHDQRRTRS